MSINFIIVVLILNIVFFYSYSNISQKFNLFDHPDFSRKLHKEKTSLAGGILFLLCFIIYLIFELLFSLESFFSFKELISLLIISSIFFIIGLYDDKYNLTPNIKLLLTIFFSLCLILLNNNFSIQILNFSFTERSIPLGNFSILFTIICLLCFINACNMFDGIDLQFGFYIVLISIFFFSKGIMNNLFLSFLMSSIIFLVLNYKKKIFIGNNGTLFLGFFFSVVFISAYSNGFIKNTDEIFMIMAIPGFDLIRVSILRLAKGRHMFEPDNQHIHHLLLKKHNLVFVNILIQSNIIFPILIYYIYENFLVSVSLSILSYLITILYSKKSN